MWLLRSKVLGERGDPLYWSNEFSCFVRRRSATPFRERFEIEPGQLWSDSSWEPLDGPLDPANPSRR